MQHSVALVIYTGCLAAMLYGMVRLVTIAPKMWREWRQLQRQR